MRTPTLAHPGVAAGMLPLSLYLGALAALSSLSLDPFLPALPALALDFGAPLSTVQLTLTVFFLGLALGQLFYGPLSDRYGRKPLLVAGLTLFLGATVYCAAAESIEGLVAGRFLQALGAASGTVLGRSIVRDLFSWNDAARALSAVWVVFGLVPVVGPLAGAAVLSAWGWPAVFWMMAAAAAPVLAATLAALPETAPARRGAACSPLTLAREFRQLLADRRFVPYLLVVVFAQGGVFGFVAGSASVFSGVLELSPSQFGAAFALVMIGHVVGATLGTRWVATRGIDSLIVLGSLVAAAGAGALLAAAWMRLGSPWAFGVPAFLFMMGTALLVPHAMAAALSPFPKLAGSASSLIGLAQLAAGALASLVLGLSFDGTARPLAAALALSALACLLVCRRSLKANAR